MRQQDIMENKAGLVTVLYIFNSGYLVPPTRRHFLNYVVRQDTGSCSNHQKSALGAFAVVTNRKIYSKS